MTKLAVTWVFGPSKKNYAENLHRYAEHRTPACRLAQWHIDLRSTMDPVARRRPGDSGRAPPYRTVVGACANWRDPAPAANRSAFRISQLFSPSRAQADAASKAKAAR
jgi:hypothetical protein